MDQSLATLLARAGVPGAEIEFGIRASRATAALPDKPASYYEATVGKGLAARDASRAYRAFRAGRWPDPLGAAALYGLAGDFVQLVGPHTEADPAALLTQFLVEFGNVIGRGPHFVAEADRHHTNLFVGVVGATSKGRKGSSHGQVHSRFRQVDEEWARDRTMSGLSSGEGLIWAVRDQITKLEPIKQKGKITDYQEVIVDPGMGDKRLLVVEPELASTLRVLGREGNTLSAIIRQAWDTGDLSSLTKNSPAKATGAYISIIGHVTCTELRRYLDRTEIGAGLANRFLWTCARRSKVLPEGGQLEETDFREFQARLKDAVKFAKGVGEVRRDGEARDLWYEVYRKISEGRVGLLGAVTSRAEAQVMRLACLYALLDSSSEIRRCHLEAALELWRYCDQSAAFIFGNDLGDPVADEILRTLRNVPEGLTRDQVRNLFSRHQSSSRIGKALQVLAEFGLAYSRLIPTGGRPAERWFATEEECAKSAESAERSETPSGEPPSGPQPEPKSDEVASDD